MLPIHSKCRVDFVNVTRDFLCIYYNYYIKFIGASVKGSYFYWNVFNDVLFRRERKPQKVREIQVAKEEDE